ncbi:MAG: tyrosine--tRNA ligase, partial [Patescibacteria group bacterium]
MSIDTNPEKIKELLERGVEQVFDKKHLETQLLSGKVLRIKHGVDPTGPKIHIGRAISLWKLRAFQDLGHKIVLIIGDFTAQIGDASDKEAMRKCLTEKEIKENMKDYQKQIGKILDIKKMEFRYNSEWLDKLTGKDIVRLAMKFTAQQTIQRRNFKERWDSGNSIGLHELLYPLLQGYDSVAVKANVEIGGYDQLFNLNTGRDMQRFFQQEPQDIMVSKMLNGLDGRKMSTSWGNIITIVDEPKEMFGKIMSMKDEQIGDYFELCTQTPMEITKKIKEWIEREIKGNVEEFKEIEEYLKNTISEKNLKVALAKEIVKLYHGEKEAENAKEEFEKVHQRGELPSEMTEWQARKEEYNILDLL